MIYSVIIEPKAIEDLFSIFSYIVENDSIEIATKFLSELENKINTLSDMPQRCRRSLYFQDNNTRDLIFKGYTISFHILETSVYVVAIFRQRAY